MPLAIFPSAVQPCAKTTTRSGQIWRQNLQLSNVEPYFHFLCAALAWLLVLAPASYVHSASSVYLTHQRLIVICDGSHANQPNGGAFYYQVGLQALQFARAVLLQPIFVAKLTLTQCPNVYAVKTKPHEEWPDTRQDDHTSDCSTSGKINYRVSVAILCHTSAE